MSRSPSPATPRPRTDENIFLFVPNLIGYTRVILGAAALTYMPTHPKFCTVAYCISALLDAVDGQAARALGQTSKFGAILDMVTDRCTSAARRRTGESGGALAQTGERTGSDSLSVLSGPDSCTTSCLLCFLASAYPDFALLFQFLISLDFSSHYIHMYASLVSGSKSHKTVTKEQSWILWSYYNNSRTLFLFCAFNELFFVSLYVAHTYKTPLLSLQALPPFLLAYLQTLPAPAIKTIATITWPQLLAVVTFPVMAGKQIINGVQFWKAAKVLVESDQEERWAANHKMQ
ncbi:SPOSA6832_01325 [Sporobolomyces salmonicolor]|uniref:SPOSA6832_01325-mRNA-1:cds n=1 Tax=Sporidiobolus salmonicolor TaxID=5005 RepID=A0A0D6EJ59_SPOSA|nr:SPOSA6832_01325 [Sporobolomyces salmonicolor]